VERGMNDLIRFGWIKDQRIGGRLCTAVIKDQIVAWDRNRALTPADELCGFAPSNWPQILEEKIFHLPISRIIRGVQCDMNRLAAKLPNLVGIKRVQCLPDVYQ
jgi:hypothetical protein